MVLFATAWLQCLAAKERTHYEVLGIPKNAPLNDVKHGKLIIY
jgi:hypothetical protein